MLTVKEDTYGEVLDKTWMELVRHQISELVYNSLQLCMQAIIYMIRCLAFETHCHPSLLFLPLSFLFTLTLTLTHPHTHTRAANGTGRGAHEQVSPSERSRGVPEEEGR